MQVATLLVGGTMALQGHITAQQLTAFVMYVEFVTSASLSVCDQWVKPLGMRWSPIPPPSTCSRLISFFRNSVSNAVPANALGYEHVRYAKGKRSKQIQNIMRLPQRT